MKLLSITRRELISTGAWSLAASAGLFGASRAWAADSAAVVETANGKLQGLSGDGIVAFKGIPYAADTGGRNRFMPPQPVANWAGVREALVFGDRSPTGGGFPGAAPATGPAPASSENCCALNVYTPGLNANARRPVMFWIHGGGFSGGNGEIDGSNLARFADVVVVAVNHRLNVFGYLSLAHLSPDFVDASCAGQLDLIAALTWTRTNVAAFGGDPQNVTVFGQSGGGSKIVTMGVMPRAQGLYRRSINMSGSSALNLKPPSYLAPVADEMMKTLGIDKRDVRKLQEVPADKLGEAQRQALTTLKIDQLRPAVDGRTVRHVPFSAEGLAMQAATPGIMSCTRNELVPAREPANLNITFDQLKDRIKAQYGVDDARAAAAVEGYRKDDPQRTPYDVLMMAASEGYVRAAIHRLAEGLAKVRGSRLYLMDFNFFTDPVRGAPHAYDIAFAFGNLAGGRFPLTGPEPKAVSEAMMSTFGTFARTGDPNNPRIPEWKPYDTVRRATLVMDNPPRVVDDFRGNDRATSVGLPPVEPTQVSDGPLGRAG